MREQFETQQNDFDDFLDKWEKAQKAGIFDGAPMPATTSPSTADHSFFGLRSSNPTEGPSDIDSQYWNAIYRAADPTDPAPYLAGEVVDDAVLTEKEQHREFPPNPVSTDTGGPDQELTKAALGQTFDEEDIKALEEMKLKLYELECKVAGAYSKGDSFSKFGSQITTLKKKIDDLSTYMSYSFTTPLGPKGNV